MTTYILFCLGLAIFSLMVIFSGHNEKITYFLFILWCIISAIFLCCVAAISPAASSCWASSEQCCIVKNFFNKVEKNIHNYTVDKTSENSDHYVITITENSTGNIHKITVNDTANNSWVEWYLNDSLVLKNGYKLNGESCWKFIDGRINSESINDKIIDRLDDIENAFQKFQREAIYLPNRKSGNISLLSDKPVIKVETKTMEITAPVDSTITGTVEADGEVIHNEKI